MVHWLKGKLLVFRGQERFNLLHWRARPNHQRQSAGIIEFNARKPAGVQNLPLDGTALGAAPLDP